jgi:hypothetical protein
VNALPGDAHNAQTITQDTELTTKTLTVRQPWASLIIAGIKTIECRPKPTKHRGPLNIHAGLTVDPSDWAGTLGTMPTGVILGTVNVVDCIKDSDDEFAGPDAWHWVLTDPRPLDVPIPASGKLGLWNWKPATT